MDTSTSRPDRRMLLAATAVGAAAIHLAMVPAHAAEWLPLAIAFAVAAWVQGSLGVALLIRPRSGLRWALAVVSAGCVAAWVVSRTVGLPVGPEAWSPEAVSSVDLLCVTLEVITVVAALLPARRLSTWRAPAWLGSASMAAVALVTTGVLVSPSASEHVHDHVTAGGVAHLHAGDATTAAHTHAETLSSPASDDHQHAAGEATTATTAHDHTAASATSATSGTSAASPTAAHDHPSTGVTTGVVADHTAHDATPADGSAALVSGPHHHAACTAPVTPEQQAAADQFAAATSAALARFADVDAATAAGYVPFTPVGQPLVHYGNRAWMSDGRMLDPTRPESLVYAFPKQGAPILLGAMFMAEPGKTGPQIGGCLTQWHDHTNLCLADRGGAMVGVVDAQGNCPAGSSNRETGEMLHVWDLPLAGGPFSEATPVQLRDALIAKIQSGH